MKRIQCLAAILALVLLLSACGGKGAGSTEPAGPAETPDAETASPGPVGTDPVDTAPATEAPPDTASMTESPPETAPVTEEPLPDIPTDPDLERPELRFEDLAAPRPAKDYDEVRADFLGRDFDRRYDFYSRSRTGEEGDEPVFAAEPEDSSTVLPVPGVETGSRAVTDGEYIYLIDSYGLIIQTAAGKDSQQLSYTEVRMGGGDSYGRLLALYVDGSRAAAVYEVSAFGTDENGNWYDRSETHAAVFDVSDPAAPTLVRDVGVDGACLTTRLAEGRLYLIANHYLTDFSEDTEPEALIPRVRMAEGSVPIAADRIWLCENPRRVGFTAIVSLAVSDGEVLDTLAFTDTSDWFCMDEHGMYLARDVWDCTASAPYADGVYTVVDWADRCQTELKRLTRTETGALELDAFCFVEGSPACMYGLGPRDGGLRLVTREERGAYSSYTDESQGWSIDRSGGAESRNRLTVLDEDLNEVSSVSGFAGDYRLFLCGYLGDTGWLMTYVEPELCWPLDLSDPAAPAVGEALDKGGDAWILRPWAEDRVLGVTETEDGITVALFSADDLSRPLDQVAVPAVTTDAVSFPAAVWQDAGTDRLGFPVRTESGSGYAIFENTSAGLELTAVTKLSYLPGDAVTVTAGGLLYVCSPGGTYVLDPADGELVTSISNAVG